MPVVPMDFEFGQVLAIEQSNNEGDISPFNLKVSGLNNSGMNLTSPGIYVLVENNSEMPAIAYIGIWNELNNPVNFGRWCKHVSTCTLRGRTVAKQSSAATLLDATPEEQVNDLLKKCKTGNPASHDLIDSLQASIGNEYRLYRRNVGLQTSYKRAAYANHYWRRFRPENNDSIPNIENHFRFHYFRFDGFGWAERETLKEQLKERKNRLKSIEDVLVREFNPYINNTSANPLDFDEVNVPNFDHDELLERLVALFERNQIP